MQELSLRMAAGTCALLQVFAVQAIDDHAGCCVSHVVRGVISKVWSWITGPCCGGKDGSQKCVSQIMVGRTLASQC
jgi:hypothetical protein